jgi:hypothetical protein
MVVSKPNWENDQLTRSLGNKEHPDDLEALSSLAHRFGPSAPLVNLEYLATHLECLAKLLLTVFHLFLMFQTELSSTLELTDLEIFGFQDLFGFIIDQVVSTKGVHHLL